MQTNMMQTLFFFEISSVLVTWWIETLKKSYTIQKIGLLNQAHSAVRISDNSNVFA